MSARDMEKYEQILQSNEPKKTDIIESKFNFQKFVLSPLGISLIAFVVFLMLLMVLQPTFILKEDETTKQKKINVVKVVIISVVCAFLVYIIPILICKSCK
jgi:hypothetical protein